MREHLGDRLWCVYRQHRFKEQSAQFLAVRWDKNPVRSQVS